MSSANKRKGSKWETDVLTHIRAWVHLGNLPWAVERTAQTGYKDEGDLHVDLGHTVLVLEAKDVATPEWAEWLRQAEVEAGNWSAARGGRDRVFGVVVRKRRQRNALDAMCVMPLSQLLHLLNRE